MNYKTQKGNRLEVIKNESKFNSECKYYQFILHEKKPLGEQITLLLQAHLIKPDYYIEKFCIEN